MAAPRKMPDYPGRFVGQCLSSEERVPTGKRFPIDTPEGVRWIPVMETRVVIHWVWDGGGWVIPADPADAGSTGSPRPIVSKHDFDPVTGLPARRYAKRAKVDPNSADAQRERQLREKPVRAPKWRREND